MNSVVLVFCSSKHKSKMRFFALVAILAFAIAAESKRFVLPHYPISVLLGGKFQIIPEDKIVGGTVVEPNSLPFQISLQRRSLGGFSHSCGGSILTENTILNAAHCVDGVTDVTIFRVVAGDHVLNDVSGLEQNRDVSSYKMHEQYNSFNDDNDIALIYLSTPLDLSVPSAKPVVLPEPLFDPPAGTIVTVSGWGRTSYGGSISQTLLSVDIPVVSDSACNTAYATALQPNRIKESMLCAGDMSAGGIDACQGDSGGPLFTKETDGSFVQHGIVSWGTGCASAEYPGVYTQVSYFLDWIAANQQ